MLPPAEVEPPSDARPAWSGRRAALALLGGAALLAATNAVAIAALLPWPAGGLRVRALHHLADAAGTLGLGLLAGLAAAAGVAAAEAAPTTPRAGAARAARRAVALLAYAGAGVAVMNEIVGTELQRQACRLFGGRFERPLHLTFLVLCGLAVPAAHLLGAALAGASCPPRPRARLFRRLWAFALLAALSALVINHLFLRDDYSGLHGAIAWTSATLAGAALAPRLDALARRLRPGSARAAAGALGLTALAGLAAPPPNDVRLELFREPGVVSAWALARLRWTAPGPQPAPPPPGQLPEGAPDSPWWRDRRALPPVPPTRPPIAGDVAPIVVLITVDALRADALDDPQRERFAPTLTRLERTGAYMARAVAPGSQTAVSLSALFSGRYFSQLVWDFHGRGDTRFQYPAADPARRFPEILADRGVRTVSVCGLNFLAGGYGVARGFQEEIMVVHGRGHALARAVIDPLLAQLERAGPGPLFAYAHLTEPHAPYDRGERRGTAWERYLSEIRVADAQIGRVADLLRRRFPKRATLIVTADHGEAFGEHNTREHSKTLYEEVLRVPLIVSGPGVAPRRVEERVGLVDLGPTILDLFGVETPPTFMGQSLVPLLAGQSAALDRPLLAEGRLRRVLYQGDLKIIDDPRRKVVEAYDLARDPREAHNLFDLEPDRVAPALAALRAFFAVHRAERPGYTPPYRR